MNYLTALAWTSALHKACAPAFRWAWELVNALLFASQIDNSRTGVKSAC